MKCIEVGEAGEWEGYRGRGFDWVGGGTESKKGLRVVGRFRFFLCVW